MLNFHYNLQYQWIYNFDQIFIWRNKSLSTQSVKIECNLNFVGKPKINVVHSNYNVFFLQKLARCYIIGRFTQFALTDFIDLRWPDSFVLCHRKIDFPKAVTLNEGFIAFSQWNWRSLLMLCFFFLVSHSVIVRNRAMKCLEQLLPR